MARTARIGLSRISMTRKTASYVSKLQLLVDACSSVHLSRIVLLGSSVTTVMPRRCPVDLRGYDVCVRASSLRIYYIYTTVVVALGRSRVQ